MCEEQEIYHWPFDKVVIHRFVRLKDGQGRNRQCMCVLLQHEVGAVICTLVGWQGHLL